MNTVLLVHSINALEAVPLATRIAVTSHSPLVLLCVSQDPIRSLDEIPAGAESQDDLVTAAQKNIDNLTGASARIFTSKGPHLRRAVLNALEELDVRQLILNDAFEPRSASKSKLLRQIARAAPYDLLMLDIGGLPGKPGRVLVTQSGGGGEFGLANAANNFCGSDAPILVIPDPESATRSARTLKKVEDRLPDSQKSCFTQVTAASSIGATLHESVTDGDLVLFDADHAGKMKRLYTFLQNLREAKPGVVFGVGVTRAAHAAGPGTLERALERFHQRVPRLGREERRELYEQLEHGGCLSVDFMIMLMVSSAIASMGLIQNSAAVVIGGMLVAPLMTPMLASGTALVQGNAQLFRMSSRAMLLGIAGALLSSMLIGLLSPWADLSMQIVARGAPNVFDLGIAFLSGVAAAYALARPGLTGTLVGVAVAVALVPPLASAGIALVKMEFHIAIGAAVLFITNYLAIVLGAALVFRLFGMEVALRGNQAPRWVRVTIMVLLLALLPTTAVLWENLQLQKHDGVQRPYARPLPPLLREAIHARVLQEVGVDVIFMAESDIEHGFGVQVVIAVQSDTPPGIRKDIENAILETMGEHVPRQVLLVQAVMVPEIFDQGPAD